MRRKTLYKSGDKSLPRETLQECIGWTDDRSRCTKKIDFVDMILKKRQYEAGMESFNLYN